MPDIQEIPLDEEVEEEEDDDVGHGDDDGSDFDLYEDDLDQFHFLNLFYFKFADIKTS